MIYIIYSFFKILIRDCKLPLHTAKYSDCFTCSGETEVKIKLGAVISASTECFAGSNN